MKSLLQRVHDGELTLEEALSFGTQFNHFEAPAVVDPQPEQAIIATDRPPNYPQPTKGLRWSATLEVCQDELGTTRGAIQRQSNGEWACYVNNEYIGAVESRTRARAVVQEAL